MSTRSSGDDGKYVDIEISTNVRVRGRYQSAQKQSEFNDLEERSSVWIDWIRPILIGTFASVVAGAILFF